MDAEGVVHGTPGGGVETAGSELAHGSLGLPTVIMQSVGQIAPALGLFFIFFTNAALAGLAAPSTIIVGGLVALVLAIPLSQLATRMPSAGGYFTYLSRTLHPRVGFLAAWTYTGLYAIIPGGNTIFAAGVLAAVLKSTYGISVSWIWVPLLIALALFLFTIQYLGVKVTGRNILILGLVEILVCLVLGVQGLVNPGRGGIDFTGFFNVTNAPTVSGFYLSVVFTLFVFAGWESSAPLGEEGKNPRITIPAAMVGSIIIMTIFYALTVWGVMAGYGADNLKHLLAAPESPIVSLAQRFWGGAGFIMVLAVLNSAIVASLTASNVSTRMWFGMSRAGVLPEFFARLGQRRSPVVAAGFQAVVTIVIGLLLASLLGTEEQYSFVGLVFTCGVALVYAAGSIGVVAYFWAKPRQGRNLLINLILPIAGVGLVGWLLWESLNPLPASPLTWAPIACAAWILIGAGVLVVLGLRGEEKWLGHAGDVLGEAERG